MKNCELCDSAAKLYCESDQANLCWECDRKVHSANFLVAKHNRTLLCHVCQSPTSFNLSGSKSRPGKSICHVCAKRCRLRSNRETHIGDHHNIAYDGEDEDEKVQVLPRVLITREEECSSNFCSINGGNLKDGIYRSEFYQKGKRKVAKSCSKEIEEYSLCASQQIKNAHSSNESASASASTSAPSKANRKLKSTPTLTMIQFL